VNSTAANLYLRRDLLHELVVSELRSSASETRLGWVWWLIDPLFTMMIYWAVVVGIFGRGGHYHPYPIFILCALLPFKHFGGSITSCCKLLRNREGLIKSVPFPTMVLPLSVVLSGFGFFLFGQATLLMAAWTWGLPITVALVQLPALWALQLVFYIGACLMIAAFGALVRDLSGFMGHVLRLFFYMAPVLYGADMVEERFTKGALGASQFADVIPTIYMMNPLAILFTGYRDAIFYGRFLAGEHWVVLTVTSLVVFAIGYRVFQHFDRRVIKFL
jgi:ABC-type polysaccharide/polyol phosphate export permease